MNKNSPRLQHATSDLKFLLNRDYDKRGALDFVGNHYLLDKRERNYLQRTVYSREKSETRKSKIVPLSKIKQKTLLIDGYNVLITIESICKSEESVVVCDDGVLRDVNAVFGKYKFKENTENALNSIIALLKIYKPENLHFFYDSQVSFSGKLSKLTQQIMEIREVPGSAETAPNVDYQLINLSNEIDSVVATSDGVIMDKVDHILDIPCFIHKIKKKHISLI
jgi:hypothetical protein